MQHQRHVLLVFSLGSLLSGMTFQAASSSLFEALALPDNRLLGLVNTTTALSFGFAVAMFVGLLRTTRAVSYADEVVDELLKVTWPSREETVQASTTVVVTTLLIAALVGFYDYVWKNVADFLLYQS